MNAIPAVAIVLLTLLVGGAGLPQLEAQRPPPVQVRGQVIDDVTNEPIAGADVLVIDAFGEQRASRVTDEWGRFEVDVRHAPGIRIRADRIGYREATSPVLHFDDRLHFTVELRLHTEAVLLAPLEVVARSEVHRSPIFSSFDERARTGFGSYFTRADIERIRPDLVTDLLVRVPGVQLEGRGSGRSRSVLMSRTRAMPGGDGGACAAQIFVDGRLMNRGALTEVSVDDFVAPSDVEGIEVYRGLSGVPPEFLNPDARCGVVAVWTRRSG